MNLTHEDLNRVLTVHNGDHHLACSMLKQTADELEVALDVLTNRGYHDDEEARLHRVLLGIAQRLRFAADIADEEAERRPGPTRNGESND